MPFSSLSSVTRFRNFSFRSLSAIDMKKSEDAIANSRKIKFDESEEHESSSEDEEEIEFELADVTLEELQKARSNGSHAVFRQPNLERKGSRTNKNRPMEVSAKKPVSRLREVIQIPKRVAWDPRFESLCGNLDAEGFKKRYNFLYENELPAEREELKRLMKKSNDPATVDELKNHISWIDEQVKFVPKHTDRNILAEHKQKEREATKQGNRPFYLKKSEIWKQSIIEKYKDLKAAGKLESYIEKRRRKNAAKDSRYVPYRRLDINEHQNQ